MSRLQFNHKHVAVVAAIAPRIGSEGSLPATRASYSSVSCSNDTSFKSALRVKVPT